jgi:hypothetical protein
MVIIVKDILNAVVAITVINVIKCIVKTDAPCNKKLIFNLKPHYSKKFEKIHKLLKIYKIYKT